MQLNGFFLILKKFHKFGYSNFRKIFIMKIAYFDTITGISGDMTLGAFVSAGMQLEDLRREIAKLNLTGIELEASRVERSGISAIKIDVNITEKQKQHRHLSDIFRIIDESSLNNLVKENSKKIFREVARAEANVHNIAVDKVHFHEVGALDSIVDVIGTAICLDKFGIESVYSSPVKLGNGGYTQSDHGKLPIPAPAAVEILRGYPVILTDIGYELTTPTGAAIIKALSSGTLTTEKIKVECVGYGAGSINIPQTPNLLRIMIGELVNTFEEDESVMIETNIDDMNPEIYPFVIERLLNRGAQDAFLIPIIMKKGRPGILLSTIVSRNKLDDILTIFFQETTSLGVRILPIDRRKIERSCREVKSKLGNVRMKIVFYDGKERFIPEFEECKRLSSEMNIPLRDVYSIIKSEFG